MTDSDINKGVKKKQYVFVSLGMIIPAAFLFSLSADLPHVFILSLIGAVITLIKSKPFEYNDRTITYSLLISIILAVAFDYIFPMSDDRFVLLGDISNSNIFAPFCIFLAIMVTFFKSNLYTLGIPAFLSLTVVLMGGDVLSNIESEKLPVLSFLLEDFDLFYKIIISIELLFLVISLWLARGIDINSNNKGYKVKKRLIFIACVASVIFTSIISVMIFDKYQSGFKQLEKYFLKLGMMRRIGKASTIVFNSKVDLNRTISHDMKENQAQIVLRVKSESPPGYLRGRSYTYYNKGHWYNPPDSTTRKLTFDYNPGILSFTTFYRNDKKERSDKSYYIYPAARFAGDVLFVPANCDVIDIVADELTTTKNGVIEANKWEQDGGYSCYVPEYRQESAFDSPDNVADFQFHMIPEELLEKLDVFLEEVRNHSKSTKSGESDSMLAYNIIRYFQENFKYDLDVERGEGDPVIDFLLNTRRGHCELFAASLTLLLRRCGIPARYVTGFVCQEQHPSGEYYVARLGTAHAWVEAYMRDEGKWVMLEPTPASGIPNYSHEWGVVETWIDRMKQAFQSVLADMRRGYFAKGIVSFFRFIFTFICDFIWHPVRGVVVLALLVVLIVRIFRKKNRVTGKSYSLDATHLIIQKEFRRIESQVTSVTGIVRENGATIREWASDIAAKDFPVPEAFYEIIETFYHLRYHSVPPSEETLKQFIAESDKLKNSFKSLRKT